jgi:hypothetical protein
MDESIVWVLVRAGEIGPDDRLREEDGASWLPLSKTPFGRRVALPEDLDPPAGLPKPWFNPNNISVSQVLLILLGCIGAVVGAVFLTSKTSAKDPGPPPLPAANEAVAAPAPAPNVGQRLAATAELSTAIQILTPEFQVNGTTQDPAAEVFAVWSGLHMTWTALQKIPETQRALVMKDPTAEAGKRLCWSGSVIEISTDRSSGQPIYAGGMINDNGDVVRFFTVGSSGDIVEHTWARLCGIVTGVLSYENSGGGTTHSVQVVGMFDLPKNKTGYAPASAR